MTTNQDFNGALVIDKPVGPTSHDIVYRCRRILGKGVKVGHTGTLDPFASGVLVIVTGQATRLANYMQSSTKEYIAEIRLGEETDTYDREGRTVLQRPVPLLSEEEADSFLEHFRGPQQQIPPMYSAVKINGERLYKAARRNETVERPPRNIEIFSLVLLEHSREILKLKINCSAGTYIRSLAYDLGREIGCGAHLHSLVRTRSGSFSLEEALKPEEIEENPGNALIPMLLLLPEIPAVELTREETGLISNGRAVVKGMDSPGKEFRLVYRERLVAIATHDGLSLVPKIVFPNRAD